MKEFFLGYIPAVILWLLLAGTGIIQWLAIWNGCQGLGGMPFVSAVIATFTVTIPLIGSALAIYGAMDAWGWGILSALAAFGWYYLLLLPLFFPKK